MLCQAIWRLFRFPMHEELPNVVCPQVHLPQQQMITWNAETVANLQDIVSDQAEKDTVRVSPVALQFGSEMDPC